MQAITEPNSIGCVPFSRTPWQDHLEAEADATLTKLTDEKTPRKNHGETISLNEKIYADEVAARRFDLQHDRNVQAKADALAEHDELVAGEEDLTADDGYERHLDSELLSGTMHCRDFFVKSVRFFSRGSGDLRIIPSLRPDFLWRCPCRNMLMSTAW